ncbi:uncharacterized protein LOC5508831 [Nematostella vectensis]|uniref:uncharacterized protein LOC5508831 n=1 Tax=Nematostella vectensis TaxID=45351 RepID=UPI00138FC471|nr:uncharacterized protein LOC5508831 [Nematostella vectensis]
MALDAQELDFLRFQRAQIGEAVLYPLHRIKTAIGRCLHREEVRQIKRFLGQEIRNDILAKVVNSEGLMSLLDDCYGYDNLRFLERLLSKANCLDLVEMLRDWKSSSNCLNPRLFEEFGYFPLWIKVNCTFNEFASLRPSIIQTLRDAFAVPAIDIGEPGLDPIIFMGVSIGKRDVLFCALVQEHIRLHIRASLQYKEIVSMLEEVNISGIYFSRKRMERGQGSSYSSLSSANESVFSDLGGLSDAAFEVFSPVQTEADFDYENDTKRDLSRTNKKKYQDKGQGTEKKPQIISKLEVKVSSPGVESATHSEKKLVRASYGVVQSLDLGNDFQEKPKNESYGSCFFVDYRNAKQVKQIHTPGKELNIKDLQTDEDRKPTKTTIGYVENPKYFIDSSQLTHTVPDTNDDSLQSQASDFAAKIPQPEPEVWYDALDSMPNDPPSRNYTKNEFNPTPEHAMKRERQPYELFRHSSSGHDSPSLERKSHPPDHELPAYKEKEDQVIPSLFMQDGEGGVKVREGNPRQSIIFMQDGADDAQAEPNTDTEDSVFGTLPRRLDSQGERGSVKFNISPPPYVPPPGYEDSLKRKSRMSLSVSSLDSRGSRGRSFRSPLLSAQSINSIYREKEMFLSSDELNESIRYAEEKEWEKFIERSRNLITAAKNGDDNEVKALIDEGADVNFQNELGHTALMVASREGHLKVVDELMVGGADPNLQEKFGKTALHEAAWSGQHHLLPSLITTDANINIQDEEKRTPLQYATLRGKKLVVQTLLQYGADITIKNTVGESALEIAYWCKHKAIMKMLLSAPKDQKTRRKMKGKIRKQKIKRITSSTSLPNLHKSGSVSLKDLARSRSRPDLRKRSACVIQ